jgi:hypothetical protein
MGQAGGYQHLPRQLGETGVISMFTALVLAATAAVGIQPDQPAAAAPKPIAPPALLDSDTSDDNIVDAGARATRPLNSRQTASGWVLDDKSI